MDNINKVNLTSIWDRLNSETPRFWKKIMVIMVSLGATGAALMAAKTQIPSPEIASWIDLLAGKMVTVGIVGAALSKLTTTSTTTADSNPIQ